MSNESERPEEAEFDDAPSTSPDAGATDEAVGEVVGAADESDPDGEPSVDANLEASPAFENDVGTGTDGGGIDPRPIDFGLGPGAEEEPPGGDVRPEDLLDLRLSVWAELGRTELPAAEVVRLPQGAILELDRLPDDPADLFVNGMLLGRGRLIELDGEWAVRIESLELPREEIEQTSSEPSAG